MLNLSKTVDRILKIEPSLEAQLLPIKNKWERTHRNQVYWKQLIKILNTEINLQHPKRSEIQNVFIIQKKPVKKQYTFEAPGPGETVVGPIPENIEGRIRRNDKMHVKYAKLAIEADLTHNNELKILILKKREKLELEQRKVWLDLKNHFNLWQIDGPNFYIRYRDPLLILTASKYNGPGIEGRIQILPLDGDSLKKLLRQLNMLPPENDEL